MKKLNSFLKESEILNRKLCASVFGGKKGTSEGTYKNRDGCTVSYTDTFDDKNGNGVRDCGEEGTWEEQITCN